MRDGWPRLRRRSRRKSHSRWEPPRHSWNSACASSADVDSRGKPFRHRINDLWLAALAIQHGMKIATQNGRDFADLPGVDLLVLPSRKPSR